MATIYMDESGDLGFNWEKPGTSKNFENYLDSKFRESKVNINIYIRKAHAEKGLQIADVVSWSIFKALEFGEKRYLERIKSKIIEANPLFP